MERWLSDLSQSTLFIIRLNVYTPSVTWSSHDKKVYPFLLVLTACTTGGNYPDKYASALCETTYACIDNDDIGIGIWV